MINENNANDVMRKLKYFLDNNIPVHFSEEDGTFYNGSLKDLVIEDNLVCIIDRKDGMNIILADKIILGTIAPVKEEKK
jgi:hypothetical protein